MGEEEDALVDFVLSKLGERQPAEAIEAELHKVRPPQADQAKGAKRRARSRPPVGLRRLPCAVQAALLWVGSLQPHAPRLHPHAPKLQPPRTQAATPTHPGCSPHAPKLQPYVCAGARRRGRGSDTQAVAHAALRDQARRGGNLRGT